jgi:hypothetical protein
MLFEPEAYDTADHVAHLRAINVTPHVTQNDSITATGKRRQSAIDGRTTRQKSRFLQIVPRWHRCFELPGVARHRQRLDCDSKNMCCAAVPSPF